jgi:hypothetical protein
VTEFQRDEGGASQLNAAVEQLIELLDDLPVFDPCRGPVESWPEEQRWSHFPVWDISPDEVRQREFSDVKTLWCAYGYGSLVFCIPNRPPLISIARGSGLPEKQPAVQRVLAAAAVHIPDHARQTLLNGWRQNPRCSHAEPEVFVRNVWHERLAHVSTVMPEIDRLLPLALRAVSRTRGSDVGPLHRLKQHCFLDFETVDDAVAQLKVALPPATEPVTSVSSSKGLAALLSGREAAALIGVREATMSKWRRGPPEWALGNPRLFRFLMEKEGGKYLRRSVLTLAKWFKKAEECGSQTPVDCPE